MPANNSSSLTPLAILFELLHEKVLGHYIPFKYRLASMRESDFARTRMVDEMRLCKFFSLESVMGMAPLVYRNLELDTYLRQKQSKACFLLGTIIWFTWNLQ